MFDPNFRRVADPKTSSTEHRIELESDYKLALVEILELVAGRGHLQVACS